MRRTTLLAISPFQGFQRIDSNISPIHLNSPSKWKYELSQVMAPPTLVNRTMTGPYEGRHSNVNRYRKGVWIDVDMHPAMRVALEPYLKKLQLTRAIPNTDPKEAAEDYKKVAPLVGDDAAKLNWLAKVLQLCGHKKAGDVALDLWKLECAERFMTGPAVSAAASAALVSSSSSSADAAADIPPLGLIEAMLYAASTSNKPEWKPIFERCLKGGWDLTPKFSTRLWVCLLTTAGIQNDAKGVRMLLDEIIDVQASIETFEAIAFVRALNALTAKEDYNYGKKFLFRLSPKAVERTHIAYKQCRGFKAEAIEPPLSENDAMFYHVAWHNSIRQPQRFSPRQTYFNYKPNYAANISQNSGSSGTDVLKEKIDKWKEEGLLPEDYEFTGEFVDNSAKFKQTMRHEHWAKLPKILKNPKYGYCGEH